MKTQNNFLKAMMIAGLAIGVSAFSFADGDRDNGSITAALNNMAAMNSKAKDSKDHGDKDDRGDKGDHGNGGGGKGGDKGHNPPPNCVPEPVSMLTLGAGAAVVAIKKRRAAK